MPIQDLIVRLEDNMPAEATDLGLHNKYDTSFFLTKNTIFVITQNQGKKATNKNNSPSRFTVLSWLPTGKISRSKLVGVQNPESPDSDAIIQRAIDATDAIFSAMKQGIYVDNEIKESFLDLNGNEWFNRDVETKLKGTSCLHVTPRSYTNSDLPNFIFSSPSHILLDSIKKHDKDYPLLRDKIKNQLATALKNGSEHLIIAGLEIFPESVLPLILNIYRQVLLYEKDELVSSFKSVTISAEGNLDVYRLAHEIITGEVNKDEVPANFSQPLSQLEENSSPNDALNLSLEDTIRFCLSHISSILGIDIFPCWIEDTKTWAIRFKNDASAVKFKNHFKLDDKDIQQLDRNYYENTPSAIELSQVEVLRVIMFLQEESYSLPKYSNYEDPKDEPLVFNNFAQLKYVDEYDKLLKLTDHNEPNQEMNCFTPT